MTDSKQMNINKSQSLAKQLSVFYQNEDLFIQHEVYALKCPEK